MADRYRNAPRRRVVANVREWSRDLGVRVWSSIPLSSRQKALAEGSLLGVCAWVVMGLVFFPLVDRGIFAVKLGLGMAPAILLLVMLLAYSVTMSLVYHLLNSWSDPV